MIKDTGNRLNGQAARKNIEAEHTFVTLEWKKRENIDRILDECRLRIITILYNLRLMTELTIQSR